MKWCVYILICKDGSLYTGTTNDLERRLKQHNDGKGSKYTRSRIPVALLWSIGARNKSEALKAEHKIKNLSRYEKLILISI